MNRFVLLAPIVQQVCKIAFFRHHFFNTDLPEHEHDVPPSLVRRGVCAEGADGGGLFKAAKPPYRCSRSVPYKIGALRGHL
jgi:hypothetical protein